MAEVKARLFPQTWLAEPDAEGSFPTNGDRFAAQEVKKRQDTQGYTRKGFMCQAIAAGWHHKSAAQLEAIGDAVGRERILVMHGTVDNMIKHVHAEVLIRELGGEESGLRRVVFEGRGHVLPIEARKEFAEITADMVAKAEAL